MSSAAVGDVMPAGTGWKSGSHLERVLAAGHFAVTAELGPPRSWNAEAVKKKIGLLKGSVDAANVTDNQTAIVRMSSIATALLMLPEGLEPIIQMTCRDRNRIAIQSDLLGAAAHGLRNLLCLSGDHQSFGDHPAAKNVYDIDSIQLVGTVKAMRDQGKFQSGADIKGGGPPFFIGAAASPFAHPLSMRPYRLGKKVRAGADFIQTQLVYDVDGFAAFMKKVVDLGFAEQTYILAGVGPLRSPAMARHLRDNVPGVTVPDALVERIEDAAKGIDENDKEARRNAWQAEGQRICVELIERLREVPGVAGVHIMAIEWEQAVRPIVEAAGLLPRPLTDAPT
ncbi:MAG TPA: methylenetetrahydrofolate reductase [Gammaproteobacteria bacterium]